MVLIIIIYKVYNLEFIRKWGLGIGDWGLGPIPNPQSPIPKMNIIIIIFITYDKIKIN